MGELERRIAVLLRGSGKAGDVFAWSDPGRRHVLEWLDAQSAGAHFREMTNPFPEERGIA
jgi:hypothetical protein